MRKIIALALSLQTALLASFAYAQSKFATEEHFRELFITAGYSTAFGAALGAAALGLTQNPGDRLQYVAMGASLGFIVGSAIGTYIIFTPVFSSSYSGSQYGAHFEPMPLSQKQPLALSPLWEVNSSRWQGLQAQWLVTEF